ncbi:unnamed protein product [Protopolystoma xenopodis]|uniref:Uncharacterized protein n=1 Tax=Protopolystoma xenopodis TaxID=117903 RepID=A0A3S5BNW4_9PLAT|nr:unnamed protein product [Protopolystoma xenopodis]
MRASRPVKQPVLRRTGPKAQSVLTIPSEFIQSSGTTKQCFAQMYARQRLESRLAELSLGIRDDMMEANLHTYLEISAPLYSDA